MPRRGERKRKRQDEGETEKEKKKEKEINENVGKKIRVGIIGCGRMGKIHALNAFQHPETEVVGIFTRSGRDPSVAESAKPHHNDSALFDTPRYPLQLPATIPHHDMEAFSQFLSRKELDGVVVAAPTDTLASLVLQCVSAGVPVMVEKPLAFEPQVIREIHQAASEASVPVLCAYQRRFDSAFSAVRDSVKAGRIGAPQLLLLTSRDHPPPSTSNLAGGGSFYADFSAHDVDTAVFLLGERPKRVFATGALDT